MRAKGVTDDDLFALLQDVHLTDLLDRPGGWDAICDWSDVLSGGEKRACDKVAHLFLPHTSHPSSLFLPLQNALRSLVYSMHAQRMP